MRRILVFGLPLVAIVAIGCWLLWPRLFGKPAASEHASITSRP